MIRADKSRFFSAWLARDAESRLGKTFGRVLLAGADVARAALREGPVLVVSNHASYWDPLVAQVLSVRVLGADAYALMDAQNLRRLPFFRKVGAFGVDLSDPRDGARALRYAAKLLSAPGKLVWLFPQGKEVPVWSEPLVFRGGSAELARLARGARTLPVGLRYVFASERLPRLYISIGDTLASSGDVPTGKAAQEAAVTGELERIDRAMLSESAHDGFEVLSARGDGVLFRAAQAMLSFLTRRRGEG